MASETTRNNGMNDFRTKAEERIAALPLTEDLSLEDVRRLVHELRVHQIEMEMQNEALREAQAELVESNSRYADLYDFAPVGYLTIDEKSIIMQANLTLARQLETERGSLVGRPFANFVARDERGAFRSRLARIFQNQEQWTIDTRLTPEGSGGELYVLLKMILTVEAGGRQLCRVSVTDLSRTARLETAISQLQAEVKERKWAEEALQRARDELEIRVGERTAELERANEELRSLPSRLINAQEEERKRLASELHDSIGQALAALKFNVEHVLHARDHGDAEEALDTLERFIPTLQRSIDETRSIYMGLRPAMLEEMGLLGTLRWLCREFVRLYPLHHVEPDLRVSEAEIPEDLKIVIFRIVQEALNNVAKHSKAEWVDLSLQRNGNQVELTVSDDGVGIDLDFIRSNATTARSLGLTSMKERAELTEGSFTIESKLGEGTTVRVRWPLQLKLA